MERGRGMPFAGEEAGNVTIGWNETPVWGGKPQGASWRIPFCFEDPLITSKKGEIILENVSSIEYNKRKSIERAARRGAGGGMGCKSPRVGHCEACKKQDQSDTLRAAPWPLPLPGPKLCTTFPAEKESKRMCPAAGWQPGTFFVGGAPPAGVELETAAA